MTVSSGKRLERLFRIPNEASTAPAAAEHARWPKITARGDYGIVRSDPTHNLSTYTVGVGLAIPIWTDGRTSNEAEDARLLLDLARLRYGSGLSTQLDISTARMNFAQAEEDEIRARYDRVLASARIAGAAGTLRGFGANR